MRIWDTTIRMGRETTETQPPSWGSGVRVLRTMKGWSQTDLAAAAQVAQSSISRIEAGSKQISDAARVRIAKALEVNPYELFPYIEDQAS